MCCTRRPSCSVQFDASGAAPRRRRRRRSRDATCHSSNVESAMELECVESDCLHKYLSHRAWPLQAANAFANEVAFVNLEQILFSPFSNLPVAPIS